MICKNCGNEFEGNFCNNCGQPADTHAIDTHFVMHDLSHGLFHIHGGLFYSARELFTRPGYAIRDYIEGKRVKHYKPISMLVVLATFYGLLYYTFEIDMFSGNHEDFFDYKMVNEWVGHHFPIVILVQLPIYALGSYLVFRKEGYNYYEHVILNSFFSAQKTWFRMFVLLVLVAIGKKGDFTPISNWMFFPELFLMFWSYGQFFKDMSKPKVVLKTFLAMLLSIFISLIVVVVFVMVFLMK
ncbi:MAG: DUF3667 domain-containing protein [Chitinophagaceae bacterium]|nr:MAG: DUF3667 domain-containing protein [Chitinophagaceae bacterium]